MKDYEIELRVRNAPMLRAMRRQGIRNGAELARAAGIATSTACRLLNLTQPPVGATGDWHGVVNKIATALKCLPADLFPPQHLMASLEKNRASFEASLDEVRALVDWGNSTDPEQQLIRDQALAQLDGLLGELPEYQRAILERHYGLDDQPPQTLAEIADAAGVTASRVQQVEAKVMRRLAHPARADRVRAILDDLRDK